MSPFDMLVFLFFILVTIKAAVSTIEYWRDYEDEAASAAAPARAGKPAVSAPVSRAVRHSAVRVTPIKRINTPATAAHRSQMSSAARQYHLKDKGAA